MDAKVIRFLVLLYALQSALGSKVPSVTNSRSECYQYSFTKLITQVDETLKLLDPIVNDLSTLKIELEDQAKQFFRIEDKVYSFLAIEDSFDMAKEVCSSKSLRFIQPNKNFATTLLTLEPEISNPAGFRFSTKSFWITLQVNPRTGRGYYDRRSDRTPVYWGLTTEEDHKVQIPADYVSSNCYVITAPSSLTVNSNFEFEAKDCQDGRAYTMCEAQLPQTLDQQVSQRDFFKESLLKSKPTVQGIKDTLQSLPKSSSCSSSSPSEASSILPTPSQQLRNLIGKNKISQLLSKLSPFHNNVMQLIEIHERIQFSSSSMDNSIICLCSEPEVTTQSPSTLSESSPTNPPEPVTDIAPQQEATEPPANEETTMSSSPSSVLVTESTTNHTPPNTPSSALVPANNGAPAAPDQASLDNRPNNYPNPPRSQQYDGSSYHQHLLASHNLWNAQRLTEIIDNLYKNFGSYQKGGDTSPNNQQERTIQNFLHFNFDPTQRSLQYSQSQSPTQTPTSVPTSAKPAVTTQNSTKTNNLTSTKNNATELSKNVTSSNSSSNNTSGKVTEDKQSLLHLIFSILGSSAGTLAFILTLVLLIFGCQKNKNSDTSCCKKTNKRGRSISCCKRNKKRGRSIKKVQSESNNEIEMATKSSFESNRSSTSSSSNDHIYPLLEANEKDNIDLDLFDEPRTEVLNPKSKATKDENKGKTRTKKVTKRVTIANEFAYGGSPSKKSTSTKTAEFSSSSNECLTPYR